MSIPLATKVMRSEQEMLDLILSTANNDARIRAVILNGSRANPNVQRDIFQDFDIVYLVTDIDPLTNNVEWLNCFSEMIIMQMPEAMEEEHPKGYGGFSYLMQFTDGNRIDLTLFPIARIGDLKKDSLSILLLDKDGIIEPLALPSESIYLPSRPTAKAFFDCCNEFWWVCPYVAKGLWREEIVYAKYMLDQVVREQLMKMLTWYVGIETNFLSNPGQRGKYLQRYLEPELWTMLQKTYSDSSYENTWDALYTTCDLFRLAATPVAEHFGFNYASSNDEKVTAHLKHVRSLPRDAKEIY